MGRLEAYLKPYFGYIALTVTIKFLSAVAELLIPYLMEIILDRPTIKLLQPPVEPLLR